MRQPSPVPRSGWTGQQSVAKWVQLFDPFSVPFVWVQSSRGSQAHAPSSARLPWSQNPGPQMP